MVPNPGCGLTQGDNFGVSRRVVIRQITIETPAEDFSVLGYQSANRYFARFRPEPGLVESQAHPVGIIAHQLGITVLRVLIHEEELEIPGQF